MGKKIQFTLDFDQDLEKYLKKHHPQVVDYRIHNQSLDARAANRGKKPKTHYHLEILVSGEKFEGHQEQFQKLGPLKQKPIIIGAGPAGLFCALRLSEYGIPSILIERGDRAHERMKKIARFWRYGEFNEESNVCYGEGGAGLFSDGKLITRIKSPYVQYVMNRFVDFGAPPETAYVSNPHLGSNKIRVLIGKMTEYLRSKDCDVFYNTRVDELLTKDKKIVGVKLNDGRELLSDHVILATGHSAKDMYFHLKKLNIAMAAKDFAIGVRIEHPRELIDKIQYGQFAGDKRLGTARYRLSYEDPTSLKGTYSFCMCPGGYVLSSGTDADGIVVNGMSNYARGSRWSNAALVVSVKADEDFLTDDVLGGLNFQRSVETKAFNFSCEFATGKELPAQTIKEFLDNKLTSQKLPVTSSPSGVVKVSLENILPSFVYKHIQNALIKFDHSMKGFVSDKALLIAPETRTSAPVTILRDKVTLESTSHQGLYPCGEGAGYAGGITSAAVDGVRVAMEIIGKNYDL